MAQLVEVIEGMAEACRHFDTPITGGNVSLYNETAGRAIPPRRGRTTRPPAASRASEVSGPSEQGGESAATPRQAARHTALHLHLQRVIDGVAD